MSDDDLSRRSFLAVTASAAAAAALGAGAPHVHNDARDSEDMTTLSLHDASEQIRTKRISPVELTRACLARIERLNPTLNAFITVTADAALASAREAEG